MRLNRFLEEYDARGGSGGCVALFDIDHFKPINDAYGHDTGDEVLAEVASRLAGLLGPDDFAARLGGDEFILAIVGDHERRGHDDVIGALFESIQQPIMTSAGKITAGISLGAVKIEGEDLTSRKLMKYADLAQYRAKQEGRGQWFWFSCEDATHHRQEAELEQGAGRRHAQRVQICPLLCCRSPHRIPVSLLAFQQRPTGFMTARSFDGDKLHELAQKSGQVAKLCDWAIEKAMAAVGDAQARGVPTGQLWLTASTDHVKLEQFVATVERLRTMHGLDAATITLAVKESALTQRSAAAIEKALLALRQIGYRVGIDQFGAHASSLATMQKLGVHAVRLATDVTDPLADRQSDHRLLRALVAMTTALDIDVLAQGVATAHHAARLAQLGVTAFQGPLVSDAVSSEGLPDFLADTARRQLVSLLEDQRATRPEGQSAA
jgi:diguanylate cyclase (GGDEF)-like protein